VQLGSLKPAIDEQMMTELIARCIPSAGKSASITIPYDSLLFVVGA